MASIKYGPLVAAAAGTIGSTVLSTSRGGPTARLKAHPARPTVNALASAQAQFRQVAAAWSNLSAADRYTWTIAAKTSTTINRVGLVKPRTARDLYFATALPLARAGATLPAAFARVTYVNPYTAVNAYAFDDPLIFITLNANSTPSGQAISVYGARTWSTRATTSRPYLHHLATTVAGRCFIDVTDALVAAQGAPLAGEQIFIRVRHWQQQSPQYTDYDFQLTVAQRGPELIVNGNFEGSWTGDTPYIWYPNAAAWTHRNTTTPLEAANAWRWDVTGYGTPQASWSPLISTPADAGDIEFRFLISLTTGSIDYINITASLGTFSVFGVPISAPFQGECIFTFPKGAHGTWLNYVLGQSYAHTSQFTIDRISCRQKP